MKTQLLNQETIQKSGSANLRRGVEAAGGKLYLTNMRLIFEPHGLNIQSQIEILLLSDIERTRLGWTKFLGLIPAFPNALIVSTANHDVEFTVYGRKKWMSAITNIKSQSM